MATLFHKRIKPAEAIVLFSKHSEREKHLDGSHRHGNVLICLEQFGTIIRTPKRKAQHPSTMSYVQWLAKIRGADKSSAIQGTVRKVHYNFADGTEMAEEYSTETGCVLRRAWKVRSDILRKDDWEVELGEPMPKALKTDGLALQEAPTEPILSKRATRNCIEWRIRNLPYPLSTYTITCEGDARTITVRTSNKKYFKNIVVHEFQRCNFPPKVEDLMVKHQHNTLIISVRVNKFTLLSYLLWLKLLQSFQYKKPPILVEMEKAVLMELQNVETVEYDNIQCEDLLKGLIGH